MRKYFAEDERFCLICLESLQNEPDLSELFIGNGHICAKCKSQFKRIDETYVVNGRRIYALYEYDTFLERLFFQLKEGRDVALAPVFIDRKWVRKLRKFDLLALSSWHEKAAQRGFETLELIFRGTGVAIHYPFEKVKNYKQSRMHASQRRADHGGLKWKDTVHHDYPHAAVIDDVLTTGSTLDALFEISGCDEAFVLAAHPLWLEEHAADKKSGSFTFRMPGVSRRSRAAKPTPASCSRLNNSRSFHGS